MRFGFKSRPGQKFGSRYLIHLRPIANSAMMNTLTVHCRWEDETAGMIGYLPSCAEAEKMQSLTFHTLGCLSVSLSGCSSSSSSSSLYDILIPHNSPAS